MGDARGRSRSPPLHASVPVAVPGPPLPRATAAAVGPVSPLLQLLDLAVKNGRVVKDFRGEVYTGFADYAELALSRCTFVPMNSNRAISRDVVRQRVEENIDAYDRSSMQLGGGRYMEFGQINLMICAADPSYEFLIMDGQHRCETMKELHQLFPDRALVFQFRAKVVSSESHAFNELKHFQQAYPTDSRSFFRSRVEARAATAVLDQLKARRRGAFRDPMVLADRQGRGTSDPVRPYLNDNLVFWLLQDAGLLTGAVQGNVGNIGASTQPAAVNAVDVLDMLERMDAVLVTMPKARLGKSVTDNMLKVAQSIHCWLGFFREGSLRWCDVEEELRIQTEATVPNSIPAAAVPHTAAVPHRTAEESNCVVCLDSQAIMAFLPCGHRCTCEACAAAVRAARPPACPVCRAKVVRMHRIYV